MKYVFLSVVGIAIIGGALFFAAGRSQPQPEAVISGNVSSSTKLYDVRTAAEYATGHIESAVNLDVASIKQGTMPDVSRDTLIALYCRSGSRASIAKNLLEKAGFMNVTNLGGLADVKARGYELVKS